MKRPGPPKESELREIKGDLVGRITEQQRQFGQEPNASAAERYLEDENVLRRIEEGGQPAPDRTRVARPKIGARRVGRDPGDGRESPLSSRGIVPGRSYGPNDRGQDVTLKPVTKADYAKKLHLDDDPHTKMVRDRVRYLAAHPEFRDRMAKIVFDHAIEDDTGRMRLDSEGQTKLIAIWREADQRLGAVDARKAIKLFSIPGASPKGNVLAGEKPVGQVSNVLVHNVFQRHMRQRQARDAARIAALVNKKR